MNPKPILLSLSLLVAAIVSAHQDFWRSKQFGNVRVTIKTGFQYEEINKCWIIGELTRQLCQKLQYKENIELYFNHHYTSTSRPDYFISFGPGSVLTKWSDYKPLEILKNNGLLITEVNRQFQPAITLKLVEYAIKNQQQIKQQQQFIDYNDNYCYWRIRTIDTATTRAVTQTKISDIVNQVLDTKVYRDGTTFSNGKEGISYFFQSNRYLIYNEDIEGEKILLRTNNVYQIDQLKYANAIVFDTDSSFYYVSERDADDTSPRMVIKDNLGNFEPFKVVKVGANKISIAFFGFVQRNIEEQIVLYLIDEKRIIQSLDKAIR